VGVVTDARPDAKPARTAHVGALDGVRGVAVVAVVAYHLGYGWAQGGYLGVDTFLVLSGYLITSGLLADHRLGAFWARRVRRLVPALVVLVAFVAIYAAFVALPDQARSLRLDGLSALLFVSNWRFVVTGQGYFGQFAVPSLLRHTWSLAVEAQLYLLWPPIVVWALARGRSVLRIAAGLAVASAVWGVVLVRTAADINRGYYGTDTRAVAFLVGAAVAAWLTSGKAPRSVAGLGVAGAAVTLVLWATLPGTSLLLFRGGLPLAAAATAVIIVDVVRRPAGVMGRALSGRVLRLLGRVSYGIYLWHWPIILVVDHQRTGLSGLALLVVRLALIALATALSWVLIERPVLERRVDRARLARVGTVVVAVLVVALALPLIGLPLIGRSHPAAAAAPPGPQLVAAVFGDSVAVTLAQAVIPVAAGSGVRLHDDGIVGCGVATGTEVRSVGVDSVIPGSCLVWQQTWQRFVDRDQPAVSVILLGRWELLDRVVGGRWQHVGQPSFDAYVTAQLDRAIAIAGSSGARVVLATAPYFQGIESPSGGTYPENQPSRVDAYNRLVRAVVAAHPGVSLFDLNAAASPHGRFAWKVGGRVIRSSDGVHFSPAAGAVIGPDLVAAIRAANKLPR
jgi:peptidoglycan/LPS O-acetylase OafA/YrhL